MTHVPQAHPYLESLCPTFDLPSYIHLLLSVSVPTHHHFIYASPFRFTKYQSSPFIRMKGFAGIALLPLLAAAKPIISPESINSEVFSHESIHGDAAPLLSSTNSEEISDSYIVVFKDHIDQTLAAAHHGWVQDLHTNTQTSKMELRKRSQTPFTDTVFEGMKHTYNIAGSLMGYSGHFDEDVIEQVRRHPDVSTSVTLSPLPLLSLIS